MRRLLFIAYLLIVPCLSGSVHADTYEWGSVTNLDGKDYTIYITSSASINQNSPLTEADTDLIDDIIVVDDVGSVVTDASLAMKVIGYYQDYVFLTSFEYNASSNYLLASPRDFGQGGTINVNSSNYFRFYIPYDAEQDDQTNIILNTVSGLGNSNVRRRIWKEVIYYSLTQRPIHKFLEEIDEFHYGEHLYDGKIDKWQQRVIETSHILDRISQGEAGASATVSSIANYIKVGNNILISDITDLDKGWISIAYLNELMDKQKQLVSQNSSLIKTQKYTALIDRFSTVISAAQIGVSLTSDIFTGISNHALALGDAYERRSAIYSLLYYAEDQGLLYDSEILNGLEEAVSDFESDQESIVDAIFDEFANGTLSDFDTYKNLFTIAVHTVGSPALKAVGGKIAPALFVISISWDAANEYDLMRHASMALTFEKYMRSTLIHFNANEVGVCDIDNVEILRYSHSSLAFNAFYYYDVMLRVSEFRWYDFDILDYLQQLINWFTEYEGTNSYCEQRISEIIPFFTEFDEPLYALAGNQVWIDEKLCITTDCKCSHTHFQSSNPVSPSAGDTYTTYEFSVNYRSELNEAPGYVRLSFDETDVWQNMFTSGSDYLSGVSYTYSKSDFPSGEHTVRFKLIVDGCDEIIIGSFGFTVGNPDLPPEGWSFVASPTTIDAGMGYSVLTATLLDYQLNPIVGEYIAIFQHPDNPSVNCGTIFDRNPSDSRTNENGVITAKFSSSCRDDYVIIADPDNYDNKSVLIQVEGEGCPFDMNPPRITVQQMCGSEVRLGLRPRIHETDGSCLPVGNYLIWTASCPGAWFEDDGVNLGNPAIIETHGEMTCNIDIYLHYSGNPCDAVITVAVQDYPCEVSVTQHLDLECPPIIDPIFSFGSSDSDYEHGKRVQFSQDGSIVVGLGTNGCDIYETKNFTKITSRNAGSSLGLFALSPTADSLAMNDGNDRYYLFNLQTGETHVSDHELSFDPSVIIWSDNRDRIACASYDNYIYILRPDGSTVATLNTGFPDDQVYDLSWRNGKLAAVSDSRRVHVWNAANDSYTKVWSYNDQAASGAEFYGCDFNSDATILAVIGYWDAYSTNSHNLYFFNTSSGSITNSTALGHPREWNDICWSPDDMKILAVGDQGAKILQASNLVPLLELNVSLTDATWCDWSIGDQISVVDASSVKLFTPFDISPPSIQSLSPQSGTIVTGPQIQVNGDIFDEFSLDPEDVEMNVNGGAWIDIFDTSWTFSENVPLDAGENSIAFRHADRMGNWGYDTLIVTRIVDNTGPVITNVLADNNIQVGSQVDISATVFDPWSGVDPDSVICILYDNLDFLIDSVRMSNAVDDTIFSCNWNSGGQCEGQIRIDIRAVDLQGNITLRSTAAYVNLFDFPQLQSVVIDPISPTDTTEPVIVASWTDCSDLSTAIVYFVFDDASANWQQRNMAVVDHSCNVTLPRKNTGWMYYSITLTDVYAHSSTSAVDSYFIADVSPPQTVSLYKPYNNKHVSDLRPTLSWQSTYDPGGSGVESYTVELANNSDFTGSQVTEVVGSASWKPIWDLAFGHYYWRVWATDNSENSGEMSSEWSFFVDDQAPLQPDSILVNGGMVPEWTNDSVFVIRYVESDIGFSGNVVSPKDMAGPLALGDTSGISLAYYKLGAPPSANDDFFGVSLFNPFSLVVQERDVLYVWLKDGAGNVDYQNWVSVDLLFDDDPVTGVEAILVSDTLSDAIGITWETGTDGSGSGTSDIYDIYVRIGTAGWQELAVGLDNVTEFDTIPNFSSGGTWIYFEVATRDQIGNYDSTGVAEDSIYHPLPTGVEDEGDIQLPVAFSLDQNYPNPFNPVTTISFSLPTASSVTLGVFNTLGQKVATVADGFYDAGIHAVEWDGSNASSGVYFYRIETNAFIETKKMVLMK